MSLVLKFPLQLALSVWLLYSILEWSALVGLLVMLVLFPIPGGVAKMMQGVQVNAMKTVSPSIIWASIANLSASDRRQGADSHGE